MEKLTQKQKKKLQKRMKEKNSYIDEKIAQWKQESRAIMKKLHKAFKGEREKALKPKYGKETRVLMHCLKREGD
jgi:hypothetical protein